MNKENIISAEYIYDIHGHKGMIKVITNDNEYWIPNECLENRDYQEIQKWMADGGTVIDNGGGE
jgi:hypothetical protein